MRLDGRPVHFHEQTAPPPGRGAVVLPSRELVSVPVRRPYRKGRHVARLPVHAGVDTDS
ncbi:MAG: hypothetical protein ABW123_18550 [Cystobacter sp.]